MIVLTRQGAQALVDALKTIAEENNNMVNALRPLCQAHGDELLEAALLDRHIQINEGVIAMQQVIVNIISGRYA